MACGLFQNPLLCMGWLFIHSRDQSNYGLSFLPLMPPPVSSSEGLQNIWFIIIVFPTILPQIKGLILKQRSYNIRCLPWGLFSLLLLDRTMNALLKAQLKWQFRNNSQQGWALSSIVGCIFFTNQWYIVLGSKQLEFMVQSQGEEVGLELKPNPASVPRHWS